MGQAAKTKTDLQKLHTLEINRVKIESWEIGLEDLRFHLKDNHLFWGGSVSELARLSFDAVLWNTWDLELGVLHTPISSMT